MHVPALVWLRARGFVIACGLWATAILLACVAGSIQVRSLARHTRSGVERVEAYSSWTTDKKIHRFSGRILLGPIRRSTLGIRADDCVRSLSIGGVNVFKAAKCNPCAHCDGRRFAVPPGLAAGEHKLEIEVADLGGEGILHVLEARHPPGWLFALIGAAGLLLLAAARWSRIGVGRGLFALLAGLVAFEYFLVTPLELRSHDLTGHLEYLHHLEQQGELPPIGGWESRQPPLYYVLSMGARSALGALGESGDFSYQLIALLAVLGSVFVGSRIWRRVDGAVGDPVSSWIGLLSFALVPAHLFLASRLNNDVLLPLLGAGGIGLAWAYPRVSGRDSAKLALAMGLLSAAAVTTKLSGLGIVAGCAAAVLWNAWKMRFIRTQTSPVLALALCCGPAALVTAAWVLRTYILSNSVEMLPIVPESLAIPNTALKFVSFHFSKYLSAESLDTSTSSFRVSLPTSFLVTVLTGEFRFSRHSLLGITFMRLFFLPVVLSGVWGLWRGWRIQMSIWLPCAASVLASFALLVFFSATHSFACNQDARYVAAAFFPAAVLVSLGLSDLKRERPRLYRIAVASSGLFLLLLGWFWLKLFTTG